ncbi:polysaccharide pyruvyl transferase family protein [Niallia sp. 03190]|uniref:polysaccharide pyruvyl transferase family protein n=1 Tax=Niallia sp. 03190 TaxID=3458061 RepID=UPI0040446DE5
MKILIDAYVEKNLGDDLFLKILFDRYPSSIEWFIICSSEDKLKAFENYNIKKFNKKIHKYKDFDAVINIGGSIFMQNGKWWMKQLLIRLAYALPMKLRKKPLFIIGCNYGPSNSKLMYFFNHLFIKYFVTDICFRDKESFHLFKKIKQARYGADIVYGLDTSSMEVVKRGNKIGICIMSFSDKETNEQFIRKTVELTKELIAKRYEVEYLSFCEEQNDKDTFNKIKKLLDESYQNKITHGIYDGDINTYLENLNKLNFIITLRFHSLILAQILGINYYPIVYSNKTSNILKDQNFGGEYTFIHEIGQLQIENVIKQIKGTNNSMNLKLKEEAVNHFVEIDQYLKKTNVNLRSEYEELRL